MELTIKELEHRANCNEVSEQKLLKSLSRRLRKTHARWKILGYYLYSDKGIWYSDLVVEVPSFLPEEIFVKRVNEPPYNVLRCK